MNETQQFCCITLVVSVGFHVRSTQPTYKIKFSLKISNARLAHLFEHKLISCMITVGYVFKTWSMALRLFVKIVAPG